MKMRSSFIALVAACGMLSACGGGGSSPPDTSATATPTPTPGANYSTYASLSGNQTFQTACAAGTLRIPDANVYGSTAFGHGYKIRYDASADSYAISGEQGVSVSFGPADADPSPPAGSSKAYRRTLSSGLREQFIIGNGRLPSGTAEYVRSTYLATVSGGGEPLTAYCVLGVPTLLSDSPAAGLYTYGNFALSGFALEETGTGGVSTYQITDSVVTLQANTQNGTVDTSIRLIGRRIENGTPASTPTELGTYAGQADLDGEQTSFGNRLTSSNRNSLFSAYGGWFFGPQGREVGLAFNIVAENGAGGRLYTIGTVIGRR